MTTMKVSPSGSHIIANNLAKSSEKLNNLFNQLSTGARITQAADGAADLAISTSMEHGLAAMRSARTNTNEAVSMIQVADSAGAQANDILGRMEELAVRSANSTMSDAGRSAAQEEMSGLQADLDRLSESTEFNGQSLADEARSLTFQVGASEGDTLVVETTGGLGSEALAVDDADLSSQAGAQAALSSIAEARESVTAYRSTLGASQNRLESAAGSLESSIENTYAANARLSDLDMVQALSERARQNILQQSNIALLTQANAAPQAALNLVG
jgi:flagellin